MKPKSNTCVLTQFPLILSVMSIAGTVWAQQAPAPVDQPSSAASTATLPAAPPSSPTANPAQTPVPGQAAAGNVAADATAGAASTNANAPAPATAPVPQLPGALPNDNTAVAPLPPVSKDALTKKKKKKGKGARKGREGDALQGDESADVSWGDPWGDSQDELRAAGLSFRFLLQTHYRETFAADSQNPDESYRIPENILVRDKDGWDVNRFFFRISAEPSRYLGLKIITDFAEFKHGNPKKAVKQAYAELKPVPKHLHFLVGIVKLPYSILELDPVSKYEFTSHGEANDLVTNLGFAGRDIGAEVMVTPLSKPRYLSLAAGAFRGHANSENSSLLGAVGARIESQPVKGFRLGLDWVDQPKKVTYLNPFDTASKDLLPNPENPAFPRARTWASGQAFSGDITFERWRLMLRTEAMIGTRVDYDTQYGAKKWGALWAIAAYKFPAGPVQLQPAIRVEWLDTDWTHSSGLRRQLTFGLGTHFSQSIRLLFDVTRTYVQDNSPVLDQPIPLREVPYNAISNTRVTGQLQLVL